MDIVSLTQEGFERVKDGELARVAASTHLLKLRLTGWDSAVRASASASTAAWMRFHTKPTHPVVLVPGMGGSILHATTDAARAQGVPHTHTHTGNASAESVEEDVVVWIRSLQAEAVFKRFMLGRFNASSGTQGLLANEIAQERWSLYSPKQRHGLFAIDTLAPGWVVKVRSSFSPSSPSSAHLSLLSLARPSLHPPHLPYSFPSPPPFFPSLPPFSPPLCVIAPCVCLIRRI